MDCVFHCSSAEVESIISTLKKVQKDVDNAANFQWWGDILALSERVGVEAKKLCTVGRQ